MDIFFHIRLPLLVEFHHWWDSEKIMLNAKEFQYIVGQWKKEKRKEEVGRNHWCAQILLQFNTKMPTILLVSMVFKLFRKLIFWVSWTRVHYNNSSLKVSSSMKCQSWGGKKKSTWNPSLRDSSSLKEKSTTFSFLLFLLLSSPVQTISSFLFLSLFSLPLLFLSSLFFNFIA